MDIKQEIQYRFQSIYNASDDILWLSYQEKDTIKSEYDYGAFGSGYGESKNTSFMPLFADIYRNEFNNKLFDTLLFNEQINKPCIVIKECGEENKIQINQEPLDRVCLIYKNIECIKKFWNAILDKTTCNIVDDLKQLIEESLGCKISEEFQSHAFNANDLNNNKSIRQLYISIKSLIKAAQRTPIVISNKTLFPKEAKELMLGALLYPWSTLIYDNFGDVFGLKDTIEGGITISSSKEFESLHEAKKNYLNIISDIKLIVLKKIWCDNIEYRNELVNKSIRESIKSAKAAIMSRNMSHNLGSHYIANTKNYISNLANAKNDKDLRGLTHLLQYIQERMDYIATVISNDVYPLGSLNIKSQIFDELTIDDCGKRHGAAHETTNFLLKYIVFSEKYSRVGNEQSGLKNLRIEINYPDAEGDVKVFTGKDGLKDNEKSLKLELSKLNIAAPCGIMARHALFNIVENIIRNSAKHNRGKASSELVITIRLEKLEENDRSLLKISIYDNMGAYDELIGQNNDGTVAQKLKELRFLDPDGGLNKENKGIKEMIISALWLKNEEVGEVMVEIDSAMEGDAKYKIITEKCLQIESTETKNLAYVISLPIFREVMPISKRLTPNSLKDVFADIIVGEEKQNDQFTKPLNSIFPRYLIANKVEGMSEAEKLKQVIYENLKVNVDDYQICVDNSSESNVYDGIKGVVSHLPDVNELNPNHICFISHFDAKNDSDKKSLLNKYEKFSYMDSISGENFTSTLITPEFLRDPYLKYKVIESALTKIAIIDERIFEKFARSDKAEQHSSRDAITSYVEKNKIKEVTKLLEYINNRYSSNDFVAEKKAIRDRLKQDEAQSNIKLSVDDAIDILCPGDTPQRVLSSRGLYIYSIERSVDSKAVIKDISGTETLLGDKAVLQDVHFLSIHLGLIEKYKTDNDVKTLMSNIERHFGNVKYIAIHSGRGNFSADLSVDLKGYCFVTLSALEAAVNNSKYMLSQLFYNMNYYGKGNINND